MSHHEHHLTDTQGQFTYVIREGQRLADVGWTTGRILVSNKRLLLVGNDGQHTIPLEQIQDVGGRFDVNQRIARVPKYLSIHKSNDILLVAPQESYEDFEQTFVSALLDDIVVDVQHPAVKGGVVQDTQWERARVKIGDDEVNLATTSGSLIEIELDDIGQVSEGDRTVSGEKRAVVEVEHTESEVSVQTYVAGTERHCSLFESVFRSGVRLNEADIDLSDPEKEVLMALYAGISPFQIPEFTGVDVDTVEVIFERLIQLNVLDEVRKRREVALTTRGRTLAGRAIDEK